MTDTSNVDQNPTNSADWTEEHDRLWDEMDQGDGAGEDIASEDTADADTDLQDEESEAESSDEAPAPGADGRGKDPLPEQQQDGSSKPKAEDLWANAPPELRAEYDKVVSIRQGLDRKIGQLNAQLRAAKTVAGGFPSPKGAGQSQGDGKAPGTKQDMAFETEGWKQVEEDYPEIAKPFRDAFESQNRQIGAMAARLAHMDEADRQMQIEANERAVEDKFPGYADMAGTQEFADWLGNQPQGVQDMAYRNGEHIVDPQEAILILEMYQQYAGKGGTEAGASAAQRGGQGGTSSGKRARQQESAFAGPTSTGARGRVGPPPDTASEDEWWDYYDREDAKQAAG